MIETIIVIVSDCFLILTYWSNFIISTGIVILIKIPAIKEPSPSLLTITSILDHNVINKYHHLVFAVHLW